MHAHKNCTTKEYNMAITHRSKMETRKNIENERPLVSPSLGLPQKDIIKISCG